MISWLRRLFAPKPLPFTWRAQWVLHAAIRHAEGRGVVGADAGDLLYGLARTDEGVGRAMLSYLGIHLDDLLGPGDELIDTSQRPPDLNTARLEGEVTTVIRNAQKEAARVGHRYIGTEHLVLGLLRRARRGAGRILQDRGASLKAARDEMFRIVRSVA